MKFHSQAFLSLCGLALLVMAAGGPSRAAGVSQEITDARQETQIWTTYALNPYLRASDLKVSVQSGKATLSGNVEEEVNKELAQEIALGVGGVTEVDNRIEVRSGVAPPESTASRSYGDRIDDASTSAVVKMKLLWSKFTGGLSTAVETRSGRVTLTGVADSAAARTQAGSLAGNTHGVVSVDNRMTVAGEKPGLAESAKQVASGAGQDISDSWITTKVKSTFLYSRNVAGSDIGVSTNKGVVTLNGTLGSGAERALAVELAQNVRGVTSVQSKGLKP
jgi:osmotically-inducible protein OsmY